MSCRKQLEVRSEDRIPQKWSVPLKEETFDNFMSKGSPTTTVHKVFGAGSLFSPLLFGKFFDPSDAFPLWEFESEILLSSLRDSGQSTADWFETDKEYVLKAELPGVGKHNIQVAVENGKVVEISGQWRQRKESDAKDWRNGHWWEFGYARRLELPENADWRKIEANIDDDIFLEIKIPKNATENSGSPQRNNVAPKDSEHV
ncbi:Alpha crystallin/Hsp20 domain [Macleaya cordata]|uniref:Alpha crystallin/Hsp20 domain n=1 Tax=Macleaya cordata TaxID=56857 RepID=A0A200QRR1_MACCD|nr:Alpha crystallin/Hsp20 domain [Macleaya cordata]